MKRCCAASPISRCSGRAKTRASYYSAAPFGATDDGDRTESCRRMIVIAAPTLSVNAFLRCSPTGLERRSCNLC